MAKGRKTGGRQPGSLNKRTAAVEAAMQVVAERFKAEVPASFDGDGVAYLQTVYRDPALPVGVRIDAAAKSARYERPALVATLTRDVTPEGPAEQELELDYSLLDAEELVEFLRLYDKATPPERREALLLEEGDDDDA